MDNTTCVVPPSRYEEHPGALLNCSEFRTFRLDTGDSLVTLVLNSTDKSLIVADKSVAFTRLGLAGRSPANWIIYKTGLNMHNDLSVLSKYTLSGFIRNIGSYGIKCMGVVPHITVQRTVRPKNQKDFIILKSHFDS